MPSNRHRGEPSATKALGVKPYLGHRVAKHQHGKHSKRMSTPKNEKGPRGRGEPEHPLSHEFTGGYFTLPAALQFALYIFTLCYTAM